MIELGKRQTLYVDHKTGFGVYLREKEKKSRGETCVLLPAARVPKGIEIGDPVQVFIYRDSDDRLIATTGMPAMEVYELAVLEVAQVNRVGAFLKWGLEKDLLLPYSEQTVKVKKGDRVLAALYIDKSNRLCATMKVYDYLRSDSPYRVQDKVEGRVFGLNPDFGAFVAVDNKYTAMIPQKELVRPVKIGQQITARVTMVRPDGKLDLSLRERSYLQMDEDSERILNKLSESGGFLPYHDKSSPEDIRREFEMSKNEFKRAIGRLYKERKIIIGTDGISMTEGNEDVKNDQG